MKKLICMAAAAAMICASATSYAATYAGETVTSESAAGQKAVIIIKGDENTKPAEGNIVYVNEAASTFEASTEFLIKSSPENGLYTVMFGGGSAGKQIDQFYIGEVQGADDAAMALIGGTDGYSENEDGSKNYGFTATVSGNDVYKSILVKCDGKYLGIPIETMTAGNVEVVLGVQINNVPAGKMIDGVWLSKKTVTGNTVTAN